MSAQEEPPLQLHKHVSLEDVKIDDLAVEDVATYDTKQTKALLRKLDVHLIPFLSLLYLLSFLE
jgi:hypothetical protein